MAAGKEYTPDEIEGLLLRKATALRSMDYVKTAYPLICKLLESQTKKAFHNQASPKGTAWPQLEHRRPRGTTGHVLRDTGELMASVTASGAGSVRRLEGTTIWFGTNLIKGFHDHGGMIQAKRSKFLTIPATTDALYAGGMRNFPRKLNIIWDEARGKGIAYERVKIAKKTRAKRGGGASVNKAKKKKKNALQAMLKRMKDKAKKFLQGFRKRKQKRAVRRQTRKKPTSRMVIHYYLRKFVIIPQRKFLEVSTDTQTKIGKILTQEALKYMKETQ